jgi:hypothetical protein
MPANLPEPGDSFLLFHNLPYEFDADLPLALGPYVLLDSTPQTTLEAADPSALADYILPGYNLPGRGLNNCCLRCPQSERRPSDLEASDVFFNSITALRLFAPLQIAVAGQFRLGPDRDPIQQPYLYLLKSPWDPEPHTRYTSDDIHSAHKIADRLFHVVQNGHGRLNSAVVLFAQVTCGLSKSLQMAYLALFAGLDSLFAPNKNKARTLARRASTFLSNFTFPEPLNDWLKREYEIGRNNLAHGIQDVAPRTRTRDGRIQALGRLHEILRLCILGFISLDNAGLALHSTGRGPQLHNFLDALGPASGAFIDGQRYWCN